MHLILPYYWYRCPCVRQTYDAPEALIYEYIILQNPQQWDLMSYWEAAEPALEILYWDICLQNPHQVRAGWKPAEKSCVPLHCLVDRDFSCILWWRAAVLDLALAALCRCLQRYTSLGLSSLLCALLSIFAAFFILSCILKSQLVASLRDKNQEYDQFWKSSAVNVHSDDHSPNMAKPLWLTRISATDLNLSSSAPFPPYSKIGSMTDSPFERRLVVEHSNLGRLRTKRVIM